MTSERRGWVGMSAFGFVVACAAVAVSRGMMGGQANVWVLCCVDLTLVGDALAPAFVALSRGALSVIALIGLSVLTRRLCKTYRFVSQVSTAAMARPPGRLAGLLQALGLSRYVVVLTTEAPLAFCFGLWRPRICLTTGLIAVLSDRELNAVLLHEDYHRRHFDPLRGLLAEFLGTMLFFLPVAGELRDLFLTYTELEADRFAVRFVGRSPLAGALHKIITHPLSRNVSVAAIAGISATQIRISELLGDRPAVLQVSAQSLITSSAVVMLACMIAL